MVTKQLDVVEDAILQAYQTNLNTRRRVRINVDRFLNITLIELTLGQVDTKGYKARIFRGQVETYAHWLTQEERCPIIAKMLREGYKQTQIAKMLDFHASTIHKDVRYMRSNTTLVADIEFRTRATPTKSSARRSTSQHASVLH
jgi:DNA-binding NarL/FixJ family response regulator